MKPENLNSNTSSLLMVSSNQAEVATKSHLSYNNLTIAISKLHKILRNRP